MADKHEIVMKSGFICAEECINTIATNNQLHPLDVQRAFDCNTSDELEDFDDLENDIIEFINSEV